MSQPYLGQIMLFGGTFAPRNYMTCSGQLLAISNYDALYNLIGTTYGGDGVTTFALPDMRSRIPIHMGTGPGLSTYVIGQRAGVENVTLTTNTIPQHDHIVSVVTGVSGNTPTPNSTTYLADEFMDPAQQSTAYIPYASANQQVPLAAQTISLTGQTQPHNNLQPYQAALYCIAVYGIYPSQG
ncbi:phage tail protein [Bradyrhizobium prioriisuperbiae]|uniref:phage tail protein n=1 Tax=Bradyrhizobium prioriisuperbiae TaxID=2854389 RepID=UPI0028EF633B|nr:tail fiber protein [Bradyrhizobium prioritasuperba]